MAVVLDSVDPQRRGAARHPEKANRPDSPALKKPAWIQVKAPVSTGCLETREVGHRRDQGDPRCAPVRRSARSCSKSAENLDAAFQARVMARG